MAVNLYMLMSGYLLYEGRFKLSRLLGLVARVWLYSVIVGFIGIALGTPNEPVDTYFKLRLLLPISMNTYWFMTAYIFFYVLVPVLGTSATAMSRNQMKIIIGCLIFFHVIIKSITPAQLTFDAGGMDAMWYVVLFFTAVYIRRFFGEPKSEENSKKGLHNAKTTNGPKTISCVILYVVAAFLIFGEAMVLRFIYLKTGSLSYILGISYAYNHVLVLLASMALFCAFLKFRIPEKAGKVFAFLGKYSLGVYLLHENLSIRYYWEPLLGSELATSPAGVIGMALYAGICVFIAGVIVDYVCSLFAGFMLNCLKEAPVIKTIATLIKKADGAFENNGASNG